MVMMDEIEAFASRASEHFKKNHNHWTYTDGEIEQGQYFALCFGFERDRVLVFRVDERTPVMNFDNDR